MRPAAAAAALRAWQPAEPEQESLRHAVLAFLDARPEDACDRSCVPGHLTASTFVIDAVGADTLLTLHPRVGAWVQLGGHCEPADPTLVAAALREATEESGIAGLTIDPVPLRIDVHALTCSLGVPTRHLDVQFLVRAPAGATATISDESDDLQWWPLRALPTGDASLGLLRDAAMVRLRRAGAGGSASPEEQLPVAGCGQ